jgi:taurine dioxygenase
VDEGFHREPSRSRAVAPGSTRRLQSQSDKEFKASDEDGRDAGTHHALEMLEPLRESCLAPVAVLSSSPACASPRAGGIAMSRRFHAGPRPWLREAAEELARARYDRIAVRPLSPTIGAEVEGLRLDEPIDDETFADVRRAFLDWKVLFFRDQHLTSAQQAAFARRFGELEVHPFLPNRDDAPEVIVFEKGEKVGGYENVWHADVTWRQEPSLGSLLRAVEVPDVGGDTLFADMHLAWLGLPDEIKRSIDGRNAVHDFTFTFGHMLTAEKLKQKQAEYPPAEHPIVRTHPETGRKTLFVNAGFTSHLCGMPRDESEALLELLCKQAATPEYQCRFRWTPGSLALWDNRAVQHYAASDYWPKRRVMERVTIIGDRPF